MPSVTTIRECVDVFSDFFDDTQIDGSEAPTEERHALRIRDLDPFAEDDLGPVPLIDASAFGEPDEAAVKTMIVRVRTTRARKHPRTDTRRRKPFSRLQSSSER